MSEKNSNIEVDYKKLHADFVSLKTQADIDNGRRQTLQKELHPKLEELRARLDDAPVDLRPLIEALLNDEEGADVAMTEHLIKRRNEMLGL